MSWKYGTILRDQQYGRIVMVTREIPKNLAGELDLFEAIIIKGPYGASPWVAVSPRQDGLIEVGEPVVRTITMSGGVSLRKDTSP